MNRGPFIFIGLFAILATAWTVVLLKPIQETGRLSAIIDAEQGGRLPRAIKGAADRGKELYQALGCIACHTQQIRVASGFDLERGWGTRQSVARDYIDQAPALLGNVRLGPDLSNVGERRSDKEWHLLHLYNPQIASKGSNMPAYAFLFKERQIVGEATDRALNLPEAFAPPAGYEVVPTRDAEDLAAYMISLKMNYDLDEAPKSKAVMAAELATALENAQK